MSYIEVSGKAQNKHKELAKIVAEKVIKLMRFPDNLEIAIDFVSEKEIKRLNNQFREKNNVTDVLSFPSFDIHAGEILDVESVEAIMLKNDEGLIHFGDMALCLKQTKRQAKEFGVSVESEIIKLVIHSVLHLMGYDHIEDSDYEIMKVQEEKLAKLI